MTASCQVRRLGLYLLGFFLLVAVLLFDPKLDTGGDNAVYLILAKSLVSGRGYSNLHLPGEPANTHYPFGFPGLLAGLFLLTGGVNVLAAKFLVMVTGVLAMLFTLKMARLVSGDRSLLPMAFLVSVPIFATSSHKVLTEMPFLLASMAAVYLVLRADSGNPRLCWPAFGLAVMGFLLRTAGIALVLGILLWLLLRKRHRYLVWFAAIFLLVSIPWQVRNWTLSQGWSYLDLLLARDPYVSDFGRVGLVELGARTAHNFALYAFDVLPSTLVPAFFSPRWLAAATGVVFVSAGVIGALVRLRKRSIVETYGLFAVVVLLVWPRVWSGDRFLLPSLPIVMVYVFEGVLWVQAKVRWKHLGSAFMGLLLLLNAVQITRLAFAPVRHKLEFLKGDRYAGYSQDWRRYFESIDWIREHVPEDRVVLARKPEFVYLLSGRKSFCYPFTNDRAKVRAAIDRSDYILFDNFRWTETAKDFLNPVLQEDPGRYQFVHETGFPQFFVLRVAR